MKKIKAIVKRVLGPPALRLAVLFPHRKTLWLMCFLNRFLTSPQQVNCIFETIKKRRPCHLLIFGLGQDSAFYHSMNRGGRTVFLEDNQDWIQAITTRYPQLEAYRIRYKTTLSEWRQYLQSPEAYKTELPDGISGVRWDIIFVDAPNGYMEHQPGRMESLRIASALVNTPGDVFVHDCNREVEDVFSTHFLKAENLAEEVENLRHYAFS
jgi:glucuronoxylan 4-O-methyltransferase